MPRPIAAHAASHAASPRAGSRPSPRRARTALALSVAAMLGLAAALGGSGSRDALAAGGAAPSPARGAEPAQHGAPPLASYLVVLAPATRWDAYIDVLDAEGGGMRDRGAPALDGRSTPAQGTLGRALAAAARAGRDVARAQALLDEAVAARGGRVLARYDTALAGALVRVPPGRQDELLALPEVRRVHRAPRATLLAALPTQRIAAADGPDDLSNAQRAAAPPSATESAFLGPARLVARASAGPLAQDPAQGAGAHVAIVDTGIDYTHAAFGGPGLPEAHAHAAEHATEAGTRWEDALLFPSARVIGGWDFAGERYSPACGPGGEAAGSCTSVPEPDPDPLDVLGHGSHVAGIAGGLDAPPLPPGAAPEASLVALKIFGLDGSTELIVDPIEWAIAANLGQAAGDASRPRVDVLNLSLGQDYGAELLEEEGVIRRAVEAGIVVVAAAGNAGDLPYVAGAPSIAADALAVASHAPPGQQGWTAALSGGGDAADFGPEHLRAAGWAPEPAAPLDLPVVHVGRGCPAGPGRPEEPYDADPRDALAVITMSWGEAGEGCTPAEQVARLQAAGARGALVAPDLGFETAPGWEDLPIVDIPVWTISDLLAMDVLGRQDAAGDAPPRALLSPLPRPEEDLVASGFSSRGPARTGGLKPDLSAPGAGLFSAAVGQGWRGVRASGTSMASPGVAGAAARAWAAARARGETPSAREIAARLVGTADPGALYEAAGLDLRPPIAKSGAGALDADRAAAARSAILAGPRAALEIGFRALDGDVRLSLPLTITNRAEAPRRYELAPVFRTAQDAAAGLAFAPLTATLAAGETRSVSLDVRLDASELPAWPLRGGDAIGEEIAHQLAETDGWLRAEILDPGTGAPAASAQHIPFLAIARRASALSAAPSAGEESESERVALANASPFPGDAELFTLLALDPPDPELTPKVDLDAVGIRVLPEPGGTGNTLVEIALHVRGARRHPLETRSLVELDLDGDDAPDWRLYTEDAELLRTSGLIRNGKVAAVLEAADGGGLGPQRRFPADVDLEARWAILPFLAEDLGLTPSRLAFRLRVQERDWVETDIVKDPQYDQVPGDGAWLSFDARAPERLVAPAGPWTVPVAGQAEAAVPLRPGGLGADDPAQGIGLLALFPDNPPGPADLALFQPGGGPAPRVYLPLARR